MDYLTLTKIELISIIEKLKEENLDKSRDLFLSNISHDVRTLLNAIYGNAQILDNDENLSLDNKKSVQRIIEASSHMIDLINNIITISKNSGDDKVILSEFNLSQVINNIYSIFKTVALTKKVSLVLDSKIDVNYMLKSDKTKLFYILLNIVGNAIKFTSSGMVKISCDLINDSDVIFDITDTGLGIDESKIEDICKEYTRGENSIGTDGFGLGLGIVSKNLSLLNSKLKVSSKIDEGSSFSFVIKNTHKTKIFTSTQDDIFDIKEIDYIKEPNDFFVLVYVNNEDEKTILNSYFTSRKIRYKIVSTLEVLKEELLQKEKDIIFIDSNVLELEEFEFLKKYKSINKNTPFISLTSAVMSEDLGRINEISTTYIVEPYSFRDIDQALIMFSKEEFSFVEKVEDLEEHDIIINKEMKIKIIKESNLGNYKTCLDLINKVEDKYSRKVLLEYLENYDFDRIISILENDGCEDE